MDVRALVEAMTEHTSLLKELLQLLEQETVDMGNINVAAMDGANKAKESVATRIGAQAKNLQQLSAVVAQNIGLPATATLGEIAAHAAKAGDRTLLTAQKQLRSVAEKVQQVADLNKNIAERFVATATDSLTLISKMINQSNVYGARGGYQNRPAGAVMINREA